MADERTIRGGWPVLFAALLESPAAFAVFAGAGLVTVVCGGIGLPVWRCPFHAWTGLPCPGCGMTRALWALLQGRWQAAWEYHPLSLPLAFGAGAMAAVAVAGPRERLRRAAALRRFESRTGFALWLLGGLALFGALRLASTMLVG